MRSAQPPSYALTRPDRPALRITQRCSLGSILSPLLSNVALSVLDEHIVPAAGGATFSDWERRKRRRCGLANYRLIRFADDWCLVVSGTKAHAEALREEIAGVLSTMGLRLSLEKTLITHIALLTELGKTFGQLTSDVRGVAASFPG